MADYLREIWRRRDFASALAAGKKSAQYRDTILGRLWQVLGPILNAIVYYFIFGVLLQTSKGVDNFPAFLIVGVFTFTFTQRVVTGGAKAVVAPCFGFRMPAEATFITWSSPVTASWRFRLPALRLFQTM